MDAQPPYYRYENRTNEQVIMEALFLLLVYSDLARDEQHKELIDELRSRVIGGRMPR